jgi:hypothetical protein
MTSRDMIAISKEAAPHKPDSEEGLVVLISQRHERGAIVSRCREQR